MTSQPYSFVFALLLLSLTLLVAGCDQLASSELERADGDSALATPNGAKGPMARGPMASGHILAKFQSQSFTASFNARTRHGATSGMIELHARSLGARVHGTIDCLRVENNEAWMSGVITQGNNDDDASFVTPPGTKFWFCVLDDAEGALSTD